MSKPVVKPRRRVSPSSAARSSSSLWLTLASTPAYCRTPDADDSPRLETPVW